MRTSTLAAAVADALESLHGLGEELQEWYDNMPENFQNGSKGEEVSEAADAIEQLADSIDIPEALLELPVTLPEFVSKRRKSRADRRDEECMVLGACVEALLAFATEQREQGEATQETDNVIGDIGAVIDEAEGVDFPGR